MLTVTWWQWLSHELSLVTLGCSTATCQAARAQQQPLPLVANLGKCPRGQQEVVAHEELTGVGICRVVGKDFL